MKIETKKPQEQLMENEKAQGIKLSPLSAYYKENREEIQNTYVMNYSSIELEKMNYPSHAVQWLLWKWFLTVVTVTHF